MSWRLFRGRLRPVFVSTLFLAPALFAVVLTGLLLMTMIAVAWPIVSARFAARAFVLRGVVGTMSPSWTPGIGASPRCNGVSVASDETAREGHAGLIWGVPTRGLRERVEQERPITALRLA